MRPQAFYVIAIPLAMFLGFRMHKGVEGALAVEWGTAWMISSTKGGDLPVLLLPWWVPLRRAGMYWGMAAGPATQCLAYGAVVLRTNWHAEAEKVRLRLAAARGHS